MNPENNFNVNNESLNNDVNNQPVNPVNNPVADNNVSTPVNNSVVTEPVMSQTTPVNNMASQEGITTTPTPVVPEVPVQQPETTPVMPQQMNTMQPNNQLPDMNNQYQMNNQVVQPQPYYNNVAVQPKKSNKTLFIVLGVVAVVIALAAIVGGVFLLKGVLGGKTNLSKPDSVAKAYVEALIKKDYKKAKKYIYIPEGGFVNDDDYLDFITRQDYTKSVVDKNIESVTEVRLASDTAEYSVLTKDKDKVGYTVTVPLVLNDGKWYINESTIYAKDWKFSVPGDTKVTIDGEEVDKKYITGKEEIYDVYVLPAIAKESKHFTFKNDLGQLEQDITATSGGNIKIQMELKNEELVTKAREFVKTMYNGMLEAANANKDVSEVRKYFDGSIDTDAISTYYKNMANLYTGSSGYKNVDIKMTQIIQRKDAQNYISANNVITLNFGYSVSWMWTLMKTDRSMDRYSSIRLKVDGDSFKIYQVTDENLFKTLNYFTNDF